MGTTSSVTVKTAMTSKIYFRAIDKAVAGETIIQGDWYTGTIYAIRIYDRVLTDDEVQKNYVIDKARHNII